jgi:hypothetical protein
MNIDFDRMEAEASKVNELIDKIAEDIIGLSKLTLDVTLSQAIKLALLDAYFCGKHSGRRPAQLLNSWSTFINPKEESDE